MYKPFGGYGRAGTQYRAVDLATRVEGASPHRLVAILYEELLIAMSTTAIAIRTGDLGRRATAHSRSLAILKGLESGLDFEKGGEISDMLAKVYREATRLLLKGARKSAPEPVETARGLIGEMATAWNAIV